MDSSGLEQWTKADPPGHRVMTFQKTRDKKKIPKASKREWGQETGHTQRNRNQKGIKLLNSNTRSKTLCLQIQTENSAPPRILCPNKHECKTEHYSDTEVLKKKKFTPRHHSSECDEMMPSTKTRDKTKKETDPGNSVQQRGKGNAQHDGHVEASSLGLSKERAWGGLERPERGVTLLAENR